jgi:hypothetical protein
MGRVRDGARWHDMACMHTAVDRIRIRNRMRMWVLADAMNQKEAVGCVRNRDSGMVVHTRVCVCVCVCAAGRYRGVVCLMR